MFDVFGNLLSRTIGTDTISFTYDDNGNILTMTDKTGTTTRTYDKFNRCVSKTVPGFDVAATYRYDITEGLEAGYSAESTTDPEGNVTLRVYDRVGRLVRVQTDDKTFTYTYNDDGSLQSLTYPNGAKEEYIYDECGQITSLSNRNTDGTVINSYTYTYDDGHRLVTKVDARGTVSYTYDDIDRLASVTDVDGKTTAYTYDGAGNRATQTVTAKNAEGVTVVTVTTYTYDTNNRLLTIEKRIDGTLADRIDYTYDNNGNQLKTLRTPYTDGTAGTPETVQDNTYDLRNQLIRTVTADGTTVENVYNGDGLRVEKIVDGVRTRFFYEYSRVLLEQTGGYITGRNVYGTNLFLRQVGVDTFYYMYNAHADVTALVTPYGRIAATYDYDPFGNVIEKTGDANNNILFAGYQYDPETGMYYLNSRMYDPITARFLQEDTYTGVGSDPLSLNLYTYCYNSPLKYYDPTGHSPEYGSGGGMYGMPASVYDGYYKYKKTADSFKSKARGEQYMKAYNLAQTLDDDSKATILQGLDLMDSEDGKFYDYGIQSAASELIATDKSKLNSESISKLALKKQFSLYMDSLKVDPSTAEPSFTGGMNYLLNAYENGKDSVRAYLDSQKVGGMAGIVLDRDIRTTEVAFDMVTSTVDMVINAGKGAGNYAYAALDAGSALIGRMTGNVSQSAFDARMANSSETIKSINAGQQSGVIDQVLGLVTGIPGAYEYINTGTNFINTGSGTIVNAKDNALINALNLDPEKYGQGKDITGTTVVVATLAIALGEVRAAQGTQVKAGQTTQTEAVTSSNPSSQISGTSYDINKLRRTQPYTTPETVAGIRESVVQNGPNSVPPIDVRVHNGVAYIVDGHNRLQAFSDLGYSRVPISYVSSSKLGKILPDGRYYRPLEELLAGAEIS